MGGPSVTGYQKNQQNFTGDHLDLDPNHYRMLVEESRIDPEVVRERGSRTETVKARLGELGFTRRQQLTPGVLFPIHNVRGKIGSHTFRPDEPRTEKGRLVKYEIPNGSSMLLDVPPRCLELLDDPGVPLILTEGPKKVDALASLGFCVVGVVGVWNFRGTNDKGGKALLADFEEIAFNSRDVVFMFDSDIMTKQSVYIALGRLSEVVKKREARVRYLYLPSRPHGEKCGVDDYLAANPETTPDDLLGMAESVLRKPPREARQSEYDRLSDVLEDAPSSGDLVVPPEYEISPGGITEFRLKSSNDEESRVSVAPAPLYIAGRAEDVETGVESLKVYFRRGNAWKSVLVGRSVAMDSRQLVALSAEGVPVSSGNASLLVKFLQTFEAANMERLPVARVSSRMGWQGKGGEDGFLWGHTLITPDDALEGEDLEDLPPERWEENPIAFRGEGDGADQAADAFQAEGTLDGWREAVEPLRSYPRAVIALLGSFAAPLVSVLGTPNFTIDLSYETSAGKTTALRVAGSVWGDPDESHPASVVGTFRVTRVFIERFGTATDNLPLIVDETKLASPRDIARLLYEFSSGKGKGRGSPQGFRRRGAWSSVMLTTGEQKITSFSQDGGTVARVIPLVGSPFGKKDEETGEVVRTLDAGVKRHFGVAGPRFVRFLMEESDGPEESKKMFLDLRRQYQERAGDNAVLGRLAEHLAVLHLTATLLDASGVLSWGAFDPISPIWSQLEAEVAEGDRPSAALEYVIGWAVSNSQRFEGRERADMGGAVVPSSGYAGKWRNADDWDEIAFLPPVLKGVLEDDGYEPQSILRAWRDRGWIDCRDGKNTKPVRVGGNLIRANVITREAANRVLGEEE
jgi:putative DNA primase/helicase